MADIVVEAVVAEEEADIYESSEDEYEYEYHDSDMEEDDNNNDLRLPSSCINQGCKIAETATAAAASVGDIARLSKRKASDLLLRTENDANGGIGFYGSTSNSATNLRGFKNYETCHRCGKENHAPITDCDTAARWIQRSADESSGITTLPIDWVLPAVSKRIREFAQRLNLSEQETSLLVREHRFNTQFFENNNWNIDEIRLFGNVHNRAAVIFGGRNQAQRRQQHQLIHQEFLRATIADQRTIPGGLVARAAVTTTTTVANPLQAPPPPPPRPPPRRLWGGGGGGGGGGGSFLLGTRRNNNNNNNNRNPPPPIAPSEGPFAAGGFFFDSPRQRAAGAALPAPLPPPPPPAASDGTIDAGGFLFFGRNNNNNRNNPYRPGAPPAAARRRPLLLPPPLVATLEGTTAETPISIDQDPPELGSEAVGAVQWTVPAEWRQPPPPPALGTSVEAPISLLDDFPEPGTEAVSRGQRAVPWRYAPPRSMGHQLQQIEDRSLQHEAEEVTVDRLMPSAQRLASSSLTVQEVHDPLQPVQPQDEQEQQRLRQLQQDGPRKECRICMEEVDEVVTLSCRHPFCADCWKQYLETMFEGNFGGAQAVQTRCPIPDCTELVDEQLIQNVAPDLVPRFQQHLLDVFVESNRTMMRWCPGPDCRRIAVKPRPDLFVGCNHTMFCEDGCQRRYCFECGLDPHDGRCVVPELELRDIPPPNRIVMSTANDGKTIQRCPRCKAPIEKNGGCNHMTCKCGAHFCWLCNADTTSNPYEHFCGREPLLQQPRRNQNGNNQNGGGQPQREQLPPVNIDYIRTALSERNNDGDDTVLNDFLRKYRQMERFAHYYNRFAAHNQGQQFAEGQSGCIRGRADNFYKISGIKSGTDTDFFFAANEILVACRRMLKYSYCYVYLMTKKSLDATLDENFSNEGDSDDAENVSPQIALFQNYQEQLERYTEQLSEVSERALTHRDRKRVVDLVSSLSHVFLIAKTI